MEVYRINKEGFIETGELFLLDGKDTKTITKWENGDEELQDYTNRHSFDLKSETFK